jgi:hypothetical protein
MSCGKDSRMLRTTCRTNHHHRLSEEDMRIRLRLRKFVKVMELEKVSGSTSLHTLFHAGFDYAVYKER